MMFQLSFWVSGALATPPTLSSNDCAHLAALDRKLRVGSTMPAPTPLEGAEFGIAAAARRAVDTGGHCRQILASQWYMVPSGTLWYRRPVGVFEFDLQVSSGSIVESTTGSLGVRAFSHGSDERIGIGVRLGLPWVVELEVPIAARLAPTWWLHITPNVHLAPPGEWARLPMGLTLDTGKLAYSLQGGASMIGLRRESAAPTFMRAAPFAEMAISFDL
jgi:hypothetical protein